MIIQKPGGPWSLYCTECHMWFPNTANHEMKKEGVIAHSHCCGVKRPEEISDTEWARKNGNDKISRSYALTQIECAIQEASGIHKEFLERIKDFIKVLPCDQELDMLVYCTECELLKISGEEMSCPYKEKCHFLDPEDSRPRWERPCWTPKEKVDVVC